MPHGVLSDYHLDNHFLKGNIMGLDMYLSAKRYLWDTNKNDKVLSEEIDKILEEIGRAHV